MAIEYNFKYMPLVGKLSGKSMVQQTEMAINEIAKIVNDNTAQAEIINTLAEEANANSVEALEKANEAIETSSRFYVNESAAVNLNDYCEAQLIYINNAFSQNLPVAHKGFLEVKTNDDKTQATQVFSDNVDRNFYVRTGEITATEVGDVTTYTASYGDWVNIPNSTDLANYLPVAGGTMNGDIEYSTSNFAIKSTDINNDGQISVVGATDNLNGASLTLYGRNHTEVGAFELNANNGTLTKTLKGDASGNLTWDNNDLALAKDFLPLNGGTMTGTIVNDSTNFVSRPNDTGELILFSGTAGSTYPAIVLRGKDRTSEAGSLFVRVQDSSASKVLLAKPDGTLTWDGNNVATTNNTVNLTGNQTIAGTKTFSSNPIAPTPATTDNSTKVATTAYVRSYATPSNIGAATSNHNHDSAYASKSVVDNIGTIVSKSTTADVSIAANTGKTITSISLAAGKWVVTGHARYTSVTANKSYGVMLTNTNNGFNLSGDGSISVQSANANSITLQVARIFTLSSTTTVYFTAYSTAASTIASGAEIVAVRIK